MFVVQVSIMQPKDIFICDGSQAEYDQAAKKLVDEGIFKPLAKLNNWYILISFFCCFL